MSLTDLFFHACCMQGGEENVSKFGKQFYYYICQSYGGRENSSLEKGIQFAKYVRNIHEGKGNQILFYEMIYQLSRVDMGCVNSLLEKVPYEFGSWKDMKKIAQYIYSKTGDTRHPAILHIIWIINRQVVAEWNRAGVATNVAKWIPREDKCFWLFYSLAFDWATNYDVKMSRWILLKQPPTKAIENKICMTYRRIISELNRRNGTVEIQLCSREYQHIKADSVPLLAFHKYKRLFLDYYRIPSSRAEKHDNALSKMTYDFKVYLNKFFSPGFIVPDKNATDIFNGRDIVAKMGIDVERGAGILKDPVNIRLGSLVKEAVQLLDKKIEKNYLDLFSGEKVKTDYTSSSSSVPVKVSKKIDYVGGIGCGGISVVDVVEDPGDGDQGPENIDILFSKFMNIEYSINILNRQWDFFMKQCPPLDNFIPFLDVSLDMYSYNRQYLFDAIGIACAISNRSTIPNRIMTIDHVPNWIVLPEKDSISNHEFVSIVKIVMQSFSGNTEANIEKSIDLLAQSFMNSSVKTQDIAKTTIVIISCFSGNGWSRHDNIHDSLVSIFGARGISVLPHIVYWNVGGGMDIVIPCNSNMVGASLQSGHALIDVCHLSYIDRTDTVEKNIENMMAGAGV